MKICNSYNKLILDKRFGYSVKRPFNLCIAWPTFTNESFSLPTLTSTHHATKKCRFNVFHVAPKNCLEFF